MRGDYATAAPLVAFAMILDTLDGRIARLTGATSDFGVEFDSLADVISFGVAPAVLVFTWGLESLGRLGWAVGFLYVTATAMRLARFNIQGKGGDRSYFVGLPSPAAAGVLAATVFAYPGGLEGVLESVLGLVVVLVPAALMVSRIRFRSFSALTPGRRHSYLTLLVIRRRHRCHRDSTSGRAGPYVVQLPPVWTGRARALESTPTNGLPGENRDRADH